MVPHALDGGSGGSADTPTMMEADTRNLRDPSSSLGHLRCFAADASSVSPLLQT